MVRLKDKSCASRAAVRNEFQFQYGAIKGKSCASRAAVRNEFQFQYGAIKGAVPAIT